MNNYHENIKKILFSADEIKQAEEKTGRMLSREYAGKTVLLVSILKGSFVFLGDLCRYIDLPCRIDFMQTRSYFGGTESVGKVDILMDLSHDVSKYHVIIVEDIIDTGRTLNEVVRMLRERNPLSLKIVTLLDKPARRKTELNADISLFTIPDLFVVGYGLDYDGYYRNLPYIAEYGE